MAVNANSFQANYVKEKAARRPSDRNLFLMAAIAFPLLVLIGYFKSYYFSAFFDVKPLANSLVHAHGIVMSVWVIYFTAQIALIRSKNIKLHMTLGMAGIALAALVIAVGMATAFDAQLVRHAAPPGVDPHEFFILPVGDMVLFAIYFAAAIYYRKRSLEHKSLMLMTAINFAPAALFRISLVPENLTLLFAFGVPALIAIGCFLWLRVKYGKFNRVFAAALLLYLIALPAPFRMLFAETAIWHNFTIWLVS
jgi:hypothetical protein